LRTKRAAGPHLDYVGIA